MNDGVRDYGHLYRSDLLPELFTSSCISFSSAFHTRFYCRDQQGYLILSMSCYNRYRSTLCDFLNSQQMGVRFVS